MMKYICCSKTDCLIRNYCPDPDKELAEMKQLRKQYDEFSSRYRDTMMVKMVLPSLVGELSDVQ